MKGRKTNSNYDVVIIGSGAGGLASGLALSQSGKNVLILEQHYVPGGWCHSFQLNGQKFSPGVHYIGALGEGGSFRKIYEGLGIANDLTFFRMKPDGFEHCQIGGVSFDFPNDPEEFKKELIRRFPEERKGIRKLLKRIEKTEKQLTALTNADNWIKVFARLFCSGTLLRHGWKTVSKVLDRYIKNPDLKAILSIQCGDVGLTPSKANFAYFSAVMAHYSKGGYFPMGGGSGIVKAFTKAIKKNGGDIRVNATVDKILIENGKTHGVQLNTGEVILSDFVISNADPHITFNQLIDKKHIGKRLKKKLKKVTYSPGSLQLFVTVDLDVKKAGIDSGNYWYASSNNSEELMEYDTLGDIISGDKFEAVFVGCSTLKDPSGYNGRYHNFEMVTFVNNDIFEIFEKEIDPNGPLYQKIKKKIANKLLNNLEELVPGAKKQVVQVELGTPKTNKFYINSTKGNVYGIDKTLSQLGSKSFNVNADIEGLFLCGASTVSHGVAGATNSGIKAAAELLGVSESDLLVHGEGQELEVIDAEPSETWPDWLHDKIDVKKRRFKEIVSETFLEHRDKNGQKIAS